MKKLAYRCAMMLALVFAPQTMSVSHANVIAAVDFSTYSDGPLVGQNGWVRYLTQTSSPIEVQSGAVVWGAGATTNNEDALFGFPSQFTQPAIGAGTAVYDFDLRLQISAAAATNPSYFAAVTNDPTGITNTNFANARIAAQGVGSGFVFGTRVNGQGGYPFAFGTQELNFNQTYALRARVNLVEGNANDFIELFVGDDFDNLTLHATAAYSGSGAVNDPNLGGFLLSQFGNASVNQAGVRIFSMSFSSVPEPSSMALLAVVSVAGVAFRKRLKRA